MKYVANGLHIYNIDLNIQFSTYIHMYLTLVENYKYDNMY